MRRRLAAAWQRIRYGRLVDEVCRDCLEQLRDRACWETRVEFPNMAEMGPHGGTYMTAYWCPRHRPDDAVRTAPGTLAAG